MCGGGLLDRHACANIKPDTRNMRVRYPCAYKYIYIYIYRSIINFEEGGREGATWRVDDYYMIMRRG